MLVRGSGLVKINLEIMKQAVMTSPGVIKYQNIPDPGELNPNEILLKIKRIGVCGSDIHVYHGKHPFTLYPVVQGHEYSALVEKIGKDQLKKWICS